MWYNHTIPCQWSFHILGFGRAPAATRQSIETGVILLQRGGATRPRLCFGSKSFGRPTIADVDVDDRKPRGRGGSRNSVAVDLCGTCMQV